MAAVPPAKPYIILLDGQHDLVTVFGGTGFLGRRIVERFVRDGATLRIAVRDLDRANTLAKSVGLARAIPIAADVRNPPTRRGDHGIPSVVNAVSSYVERDGVTYAAVHVQGADNVTTACQQQGVTRPVHISGIGANPASRSAISERVAWVSCRRESVSGRNDHASQRHVRRNGGFLTTFAKIALPLRSYS